MWFFCLLLLYSHSLKLMWLQIPEVHKKLHLVLHSLAAVQGAMQQLQEKLVTSDANEWQEAIAKTTQLKVRLTV